jgi:GNAT superfamily N-acetyltransferase
VMTYVPTAAQLAEFTREDIPQGTRPTLHTRVAGEHAGTIAAKRIHAEGTARLAASGLEVEVRPPHESEANFLIHTTVCVFWPRKDRLSGMTFSRWESLYRPQVMEVVRDGRALVATASHESQRVILGYIMVDEFDCIACLYVKPSFRSIGIGIMLIEAAGLDLPIKTAVSTGCWKRWTKYHDIPVAWVSDNDRKRWKLAKEQVG